MWGGCESGVGRLLEVKFNGHERMLIKSDKSDINNLRILQIAYIVYKLWFNFIKLVKKINFNFSSSNC